MSKLNNFLISLCIDKYVIETELFLYIIFESVIRMSFSKKTAEIMHTLQTDYGDFKVPANKKSTQPENQTVKPCRHNCSAVEVKINSGSGAITNRKNMR